MKTTYILAGFVVLLLVTSAAWSRSDEECDYSGKQSQMNACAIRDFETSDRDLNQIYKQLMSSLTKPEQKKASR
jgi:uncharacterized protein YecT (DUF1311 family)